MEGGESLVMAIVVVVGVVAEVGLVVGSSSTAARRVLKMNSSEGETICVVEGRRKEAVQKETTLQKGKISKFTHSLTKITISL